MKVIISSYGPYSPLVFILIQILQVVVAPIPGGAVEFLGGYLFGVWAGFVYSMIGLLFGSWFAFSLGRFFEKWAVEKFVSPRTLRKFDYLIGHEGVILSFFLFLIPGFPKDALCYILGLTPMHLGIFLIISTMGAPTAGGVPERWPVGGRYSAPGLTTWRSWGARQRARSSPPSVPRVRRRVGGLAPDGRTPQMWA